MRFYMKNVTQNAVNDQIEEMIGRHEIAGQVEIIDGEKLLVFKITPDIKSHATNLAQNAAKKPKFDG